jgi:hypothetical protein
MSNAKFDWTEEMGELVCKSIHLNLTLYIALDKLRCTLHEAGSKYAIHDVRYLQKHLEEIETHLQRLSRYEGWMRDEEKRKLIKQD